MQEGPWASPAADRPIGIPAIGSASHSGRMVVRAGAPAEELSSPAVTRRFEPLLRAVIRRKRGEARS